MASTIVRYGAPTAVIVLIFTLYLYCLTDFNVRLFPSERTATLTSQLTSRNRFFVRRYNFGDDTLRLQGFFDQSGSEGDTETIEVDGISNLVNQIKPFIARDEKFQRAELEHEHFFNVDRKVKEVSCIDIFKGNSSEIQRAVNITETYKKVFIEAKDYLEMTKNCSSFISSRGYITDPLTEFERDFPIAFSLMMFKDVEQSERLLRAIYRPQNIYCVHVDKKSSSEIYTAMESITKCFDNVFMTSKRFDVKWGGMTVLEPDLLCMEELWNKSKTWKYFINLTGQEFPLRTNYELVRILQAFNGANDIEGTIKRANKDRWQNAGSPPHNITPVKGAVHITVCRGFVDYVLHDQRAKDLLNWTRPTRHPDETFFATLNHNPHLQVPGAYKGLAEPGDMKPFVGRFKNWGRLPCKGKFVRSICIIAVGDLPHLWTSKNLIVNKLHLSFHPFALDCLEEMIFNRTRDEYIGAMFFDSRWYGQLGFVNNKV